MFFSGFRFVAVDPLVYWVLEITKHALALYSYSKHVVKKKNAGVRFASFVIAPQATCPVLGRSLSSI